MCASISVKYQEHFILIRPPVLQPDNSYFPHLPKSIILCKCQLIWEASMRLSSSVKQTTIFLLCIAIFCMLSGVCLGECAICQNCFSVQCGSHWHHLSQLFCCHVSNRSDVVHLFAFYIQSPLCHLYYVLLNKTSDLWSHFFTHLDRN